VWRKNIKKPKKLQKKVLTKGVGCGIIIELSRRAVQRNGSPDGSSLKIEQQDNEVQSMKYQVQTPKILLNLKKL